MRVYTIILAMNTLRKEFGFVLFGRISKRSFGEADTLSNTRKAFVNDPFSDSKTNLGGSGERVNSSVAG